MLRGVVPAAVTPRRKGKHEIDLGAALEVIDFLASKGAAGITLLGTTGEYVHFDADQRMRLTNLTVKRSRVPLIVNVSASTLDEAVALGDAALDGGAVGVLLMPPYFYRYRVDEVREFYLRFAERTDHDPGNILIYHYPDVSSPIGLELVLELLRDHGFGGVKDSSGDWEFLSSTLAAVANERAIFCGSDPLFSQARRAGAVGAVSGIAMAVPELLVALDQALQAGETQRADALQAHVNEFAEWWGKLPPLVTVKEALALRKVPGGPPTVTLSPQAALRADEFRLWFNEWLPEVLGAAKGAAK